MIETSARLLKLLTLLQSPRDWTGAELAEKLQVSPRTVRSDVERLRSLGYPVDATRGSVGGYRLGAGAALPPLLLDDDEAVAVVIGLRKVAGIAGVEEMSLRALSKLEQVLPSRLRRRVNTLASYTVQVPPDEQGPQVDPELLTQLAGLCRDREQLRFDYLAHGGSETLRRVEPHRLVNWGRRWYLVAFDLDRDDWRTFRADRMRPRIPTGPRFPPRALPADGDVAAYVSRRVSAAAWRYEASVEVAVPAAVLAERLTPAVGVVELIDEKRCLLRTGSDSVQSLAVHLSLLDADFVVREGPPELTAYLERLAERYRRATSS
ncbi:helix-turn-helix transcriptional regulator [Kribbella shirazensis]|uniref:Putative DNA-binding transcriptional regulator YafY n=1 Tax=Kribbella shirazensis TaxID=1105143 RepID=A0A7X5VEX2_9ACTN|nr:YafY family protein [Kribbella shirazensis]NIK59893.1 putative DNA-binding transcriptional regulator YafY [Kribbella shirazensis]